MGWWVQGPIADGGKIFCTCPVWPWAHPASYKMGTGSLSRGL